MKVDKNIFIKNIIFLVLFLIAGIFILLPLKPEGKHRTSVNELPSLDYEFQKTTTDIFKKYRYSYRTDYRILTTKNKSFVQVGESFYLILAHAGISRKDISVILKKSKKHFNPSRIRKGSLYHVTKNGKGEFVELEFYYTQLNKLIVTKKQSKLNVKSEKVPVEIRIEAIAGTLNNSLYQSVTALGEKEQLVYEMVDIFQWDIDFYIDPRKGDIFEILFEKLYIDGKFFSYGRILSSRYKGPIAGDNKAYYFSYKKSKGYYNKKGNSLKSQFQKSPLKFTRISSGYTNRRFHPVLKIYRPHRGIDYAAPTGTPVKAVADGKIVYAGWKGQAGKVVIIKHKNGYRTSYGHLHRIPKHIKKNKYIKQGQVIGYVGKTGLATGPHLDFRVRKNGKFINPLKLKKIPSSPVPKKYKKAYFKKRDEYDSLLENILKKKNSENQIQKIHSQGSQK